MRVSVNISNYTWRGRTLAGSLAEVVRAADDIGLDTVWVPDQLLQADPHAGSDRDMLEPYTALGFLAATSRRVRLGTMVSAVTFRPPALLIKAVTTLDVLSGGRAWLGIGAGYLGSEAEAMGLPLPPTAERFEHLEDALQLAAHMWSGSTEPFLGRRHRLAAPADHPGPLTRPHPPILVGGSGEQRTLRLVAQYADACNLFDIPDGNQTTRHKLQVLDQHCREVGRPPDEVERTLSTRQRPDQSLAEFTRHCQDVAALGIHHVILHSGRAWTVSTIQALSPIVEHLAA